MAATATNVPSISKEDLAAFHAVHFSTASADHFTSNFLGPVEEEYEYTEEVEDDDGLGYYEDGVKRTLTDAQIAIFRHSEIQALLRERRYAAEGAKDEDSTEQTSKRTPSQGEIEDGKLGDENIVKNAPALSLACNEKNLSRKARKAQQAKQKGFFKQKIKPDLRKRTWDKVESGMESLDYDGQSSGVPVANPASQRRRIFYD